MRPLFLLVLVALAACRETVQPIARDTSLRRFGDFIIPIDSIQAPDSAVSGDSISVRLFPAPPWRCAGWTVIRSGMASGAMIVPWGVHQRQEACESPLQQHEFRVRAEGGDTVSSVFTVVIRQPNMTPETDGLPAQVWRDTVLIHEVRLPAIMPPSSGVDDYWRWRGYQPRPRDPGDMGRDPRHTPGPDFRCAPRGAPLGVEQARTCAEQWVRDNGYTDRPPSADRATWSPERGEPLDWPATFALRRGMLADTAVRAECYGGRCEVWFAYQHPRFVCRHRIVRISRPPGMPELIAISERDVLSATRERRRCIPR